MPWRLIGESVQVVVAGGRVSIRPGTEVASHAETWGRRQRVIEPVRFTGVAAGPRLVASARLTTLPVTAAELLRPLYDYERLVGGGWRWHSTMRPWSAC